MATLKTVICGEKNYAINQNSSPINIWTYQTQLCRWRSRTSWCLGFFVERMHIPINLDRPHTSHINSGDVTILNQKRLSLATMTKSAIVNCFSGIVCSGHQIACKKWNNTFVTVNNDLGVTREAICQWFSLVTSSLVKIIGKSPHSWPPNRYAR